MHVIGHHNYEMKNIGSTTCLQTTHSYNLRTHNTVRQELYLASSEMVARLVYGARLAGRLVL